MTVVEDESSVYVKGLSCHLAQNEEEALNLLFEVCDLGDLCCSNSWNRNYRKNLIVQNSVISVVIFFFFFID